jgi:hypothetical protein
MRIGRLLDEITPFCNSELCKGDIVHVNPTSNQCDIPEKMDGILGISLDNVVRVDVTKELVINPMPGSKMKVLLIKNEDHLVVYSKSKITTGQKIYYCPTGKLWSIKEIKNRFLKRIGIALSSSDTDGHFIMKVLS